MVRPTASTSASTCTAGAPCAHYERRTGAWRRPISALAACVEEGLPLVPRPFAAWADRLRCTPVEVRARIQAWLDAGTLRRFGLVVRHHEVGFAANAMTVFDVDDARSTPWASAWPRKRA